MNNQYAPPQSEVDGVNTANSAGITSSMLNAMQGTKPWVLLIGIVLMISAVFTLLGTVGIMGMSVVGVGGAGPGMGAMLGIGIVYAVMGVVYILLAVYLFKYSSAIGRLLQSASVVDMEDALHSQRKFWKFSGILTAVMLVLMVLGLIAAMVIPFFTMMNI